MLPFEQRAHAEKDEIGCAGQFHENESPGRSRERSRQPQRRRACVKNTAHGNPQRGRDTSAASMRNAAAEYVERVGPRRKIQQNPGGDEQHEIVDPEHGKTKAEMLKN
jgi:hypothetical protein